MNCTNNSIREFLGKPTFADFIFPIDQVDSIGESNRNTLMFINKEGIDLEYIDGLSASCVYLIDESYPEFESTLNDFIRVSNPKYKFYQLQKKFGLRSKFQREFGKEYSVNPSLDDRFHCWECSTGKNLKLDKGVVIGGEDFSPVLADDGSLVQFPQLGGVLIGDDVTIKYNTMVGRGTFGYTKIGNNTMIDFGCQIGHNCVIGDRCIIAAGTIIGGSTIVGSNTVIGMGATIRNGTKIGQNVSIGMGSVVIKEVPDNCVVVGNPARIIEHKHIFDEKGLV